MTAMVSERVFLGLAGEPHQGNLVVCNHLEKLWWAQSAQKILDTGLPADAVGLVFLPMWDWAAPRTNVGRKALAENGGQSLLPVRRSYDSESIVVVTRSMRSFKVGHEAVGMGHLVSGEQTFTFSAGARAEVSPRTDYSQVGETLGALRVGEESRDEIVASLRNIVQSANTEDLWLGMYPLIHKMSIKIVVRNQEAFTFEINALGKQSAMALDPIDVDKILDEMIYGNATEQAGGKPSAAERLIACLLDPSKGTNVDPKKYMAETIQRESFRAIQRALGDPVQGMQIRTLARKEGLTDYAQIAEEFTKSNGKLVTEALVRKAMEIGPSVHANGCDIDGLGDLM